MRNSLQEGRALTLAAPAGGTVAGRVYVFGDIITVATSTLAVGVLGSFETEGSCYQFAKLTGEAWTVGQKVYWDPVAFRMTTTAGALALVGNAIAAQAAGDIIGNVRMRFHLA